jgi:hypothetical protein
MISLKPDFSPPNRISLSKEFSQIVLQLMARELAFLYCWTDQERCIIQATALAYMLYSTSD